MMPTYNYSDKLMQTIEERGYIFVGLARIDSPLTLEELESIPCAVQRKFNVNKYKYICVNRSDKLEFFGKKL